ncbi:MAG: serine hydrolase, partial [Candidatus Cloacimonetes bacterium]|nr:serine hydrolase [Candidatus Cloacimonadota bacterium]
MNRITLSTLKIILLVAIILSPIFVLAKSKAYMGVSCIDIQIDTVNRLRLKNSEGVLIVNVVDSSPADVSGLKIDDVIIQMDRTRIKTMDDFIKAAGSYKANKKAKISFIRKGETKIIPITFAERPKQIEPTDLSYDSAKENQINQLLDYVDKHNPSMGSLAISKEKDILFSRAIGYKQIGEATSLLADAETKYRVGSISKTFTSVMIHQLIEEGKLSSDTKLDSFFPAIPNSGKITIRMMLTHRSGIGSFTDAKDYLGWNLVARSQKEVIQKILDQKPVFKPGKKTAYSNSNYLLLGYIIEAIDKTAYSESLAKRITQKIGLSHTYYGGKIDVANNEALSYYNTGEWVLNPETDMSVPGGAGAIVSTASDLVLFIQALFKGELISAKSLEQMLKEKDGMSSGIFQLTIG